jgi:hypothetical protein
MIGHHKPDIGPRPLFNVPTCVKPLILACIVLVLIAFVFEVIRAFITLVYSLFGFLCVRFIWNTSLGTGSRRGLDSGFGSGVLKTQQTTRRP